MPGGLARLATADVVVVVDALHLSSTVADAVAGGAEVDLTQAFVWSENGAAVAAAAEALVVLLGVLCNVTAAARAVQALQECRRARTSVAVIAAGAQDVGAPRFAVEDHLGAGATVAALTDLGIDHTAPDAPIPTSVSDAAMLDVLDDVPVLRDGRFVRFE